MIIENLDNYKHLKSFTSNRDPKRFCDVDLLLSPEGKKVISKSIDVKAASEGLQARFENELRFSFQSPCLPHVIGIHQSRLKKSLLLEYREGLAIDEYWKSLTKKERKLTLPLLIEAIVNLFEEIEKQNIVHLDLNPKNILIDPEPDGIRAKLIDFGLSRYKGEHINSRTFQLHYSAPEIIVDKKWIASFQCDVYSMGVLLYRLLTSELPFYHSNPSLATNLCVSMPLQKHRRMSEEQFKILAKACTKPAFGLPPHLLRHDERHKALVHAASKRQEMVSEFLREFRSAPPKKRNWLSLP